MTEYKEKIKNDDVQSYELASIGSRLLAYIIDSIVLSLLTSAPLALVGYRGIVLSIAIYFLYYWYFWTERDGQTPGKMLMNIKVIRVDGTPMNAGDTVLRFIGYWISSMVFSLGFLWAAFDAQSQGWHDKIASTYVVKVEPDKQKKRYVEV